MGNFQQADMTILDRILKRFGYQRARHARRSFEGGNINRLTADWVTSTQSPDSLLREQLPVLRARSRDLAINNDYAQKFLTMVKANVLGQGGMTLKNKAKEMDRRGNDVLDDVANRRIEAAWKEWAKPRNCTVSRDRSWQEVQQLILETVAVDGEAFIKLHTGFDNDFGFAIELIESDNCDEQKNEVLDNGNQVRLGVELNNWRQPVAYWLHTSNPNDNGFNYGDTRRVRVPASGMLHPFMARRFGQTRGYPWLAISMLPLRMLGGYEEAELIAARISASKMGFLKATGDTQYQGEKNAAGDFSMDVQPGGIERLPEGLEFQSWNPDHPNAGFGDFVKACLRRVAAGLNVSYNTLANDLEGVNFSSGRLGLQDEREFWKLVQSWYASHISNPIFEAWLEPALAGGAISLPSSKFDKFNAATWHGRRWNWVDPTKEVTAKIMELNAGLTSHTRILAELGIDEDELLDEIAAFKQKADAKGLDFEEIGVTEQAQPATTLTEDE